MLARYIRRSALSVPRLSLLNNVSVITRSRSQSHKPANTTPTQETIAVSPIHESFAQHTVTTIDYFRRFLKFSALSLFIISVTTWTAFEGAHYYVEHVELAPEKDEEVRKWQWDLEAEKWTGGQRGGTDPGLGYYGRHTLRGAWMAQNWGTGSGSSVIGSNAFSGKGGSGAGGLNVVEARLEYAQEFISAAMQVAQRQMSAGKLRPQTIAELLARHASVMERMGTRDGLFEARAEYERVWAGHPGKGTEAARIALKLGDVNARLGDREDALAWWSRAMQLVLPPGKVLPETSFPIIPPSPPSEPLAQRTFISILVSLSAFYATTGQLRKAQAVQESSLDVLRSIRQPESFDSTSAPQALHALYILHRSSLLSIHLAEVLYALRKKPVASLEYLARAAESSERVALALTGLSPSQSDSPGTIVRPPSSETSITTAYANSVSMQRPAKSLLRDARRTAAEAWSLTGILAEESDAPGSSQKALECYERALRWAGIEGDKAGGFAKAGEGILETEWKVLRNNYVRARDAVRGQQEKK